MPINPRDDVFGRPSDNPLQNLPRIIPQPTIAPQIDQSLGVPPPLAPARPQFGPPEVFGPPAPDKPVVPNNVVPPSSQGFKEGIEKKITQNCLNQYYQCTYHWRLFMATEVDLAQSTQAKDISTLLLNMQKIPMVVIAETGVTGYNIKDVEISTKDAPNPDTRDQKAAAFKMTITEPLGVSFLDAMAEAGSYLDIKDWLKVNYYLQLSFTGYTEDGRFAGNPIQTGFKNGGQWIWAVKCTNIETKVNEGGGVYTLSFVPVETQSVLSEAMSFTSPSTAIVAEGNTLGELFTDYTTKLNQAWKDNFKITKGNGLMQFEIKTHPIPFPPYANEDPKDFTLQPQDKDKSPIRSNADKNKWTAHVAPRQPISEFITSAIKATEEGQKLFKNEPIKENIDSTATTTNSDKFRVSTLFTIEPVIDIKDFDKNTGNYTKFVTIHVTPRYSQGIIASRVQMDNANEPGIQRAMLDHLSKNGFIRKQYDYIFTGLNTEVIDLNINFNLKWQAMLPKFAGKRMGYNNEAIAARIDTEGTSPATFPQDDSSLIKENTLDTVPLSDRPKNEPSPSPTGAVTAPQPAPGMASSTAQSGPVAVGNLGLVFDPATGLLGTPNAGGLGTGKDRTFGPFPLIGPPTAEEAEAIKRLQSTTNATQPEAVAKRDPPTTASPAPAQGQNIIYIEDILTRMAQGQRIGDNVLPVSFSYHYHDTERDSGSGMSGQDHSGVSVMGLSTQLYAGYTGALLQIEMTIRGDPFWIGQGNYERRFMLASGKTLDTDDNAIPDYSSGAWCILLYFKYPLQIGDDFKPILRDSECFTGIYQITEMTHTFADGAFKQRLKANRLIQINLKKAFADDPSSVGGGSGSSANKDAVKGNNQPSSGSTPGSGSSNPSDPRGIRNNNPMNLQYLSYQPGVTGQDGRFGTYATMEDGVAAAMNQLLINQNQHGQTTIQAQIADPVHGWTPASENGAATNGSIMGLSTALGISPTAPLDLSDPATAQKFIATKIQQENGQSVDSSTIAAGVAKGISYYNSRH